MPFYEYQCDKCGEINEDFRPLDSRLDPFHCPVCGGSGKYLVSAARNHFKHTDREVRIPSNPTTVWMGGKK